MSLADQIAFARQNLERYFMTNIEMQRERAAFEKWATEQGWEIGIRYPDEHPTYGRYEEGAIQYMWAAWRTRAGQQVEPSSSAGEDIVDLLEARGDDLSKRAARHIRLKRQSADAWRQQALKAGRLSLESEERTGA